MKDTTIIEIADKLNIGKSTVSRALRHCGGVDSETRQSILAETGILSYDPDSHCDLYTILPNVPQYFWDPVFQGILSEKTTSKLKIKNNIYTKLRDEETVLHYLDEAEQLNARAIIISTHVTEKIYKRLAHLSYRRLVILLSEYDKITNCFFVGSDMHHDGYMVGKQYLSSHTDKKLVLLTSPNNQNAQARLDGFCQAIEEEAPELIRNAIPISIDASLIRNQKTLPSRLASLLANAITKTNDICIYSPFGLHALPLAIKKAKLSNCTVCLCHDFFENSSESCIQTVCNQDTLSQGKTAMHLAIKYIYESMYPDYKNTYIASIITTN